MEQRLRTLNVCGVTLLCHFVLLGLPVTLNNGSEIAQRAYWKHMYVEMSTQNMLIRSYFMIKPRQLTTVHVLAETPILHMF